MLLENLDSTGSLDLIGRRLWSHCGLQAIVPEVKKQVPVSAFD